MQALRRTRGWLAALTAALLLTAVASGQKGAPSATELDTLLGPVALYPDQLLAPMLVCAGNPAKVAALGEWLASQSLTGSELQAAAVSSGFDESFAALVLFPDVVRRMAEQADWTRKVGQAFTADKSAVFASIQRLRAKAQKAGTLKTTPQQEVETKTTSSWQQVIVIEPANPQVVYVPQYNSQVVYVEKESNNDAAVAGLIGFTAGIAIGAAIDNNYYYGPYGYHGAYMYNDAWDDWYDNREDAREDWQDHREDLADERGDRAKDTQEQRTERQKNAQEQRSTTERSSTARASERSAATASSSATQQTKAARGSQEARGYTGDARTSAERSGTKSDAFSNYGNGKSERAASSRGQKSRSSSRSGGSRRR
jgi:hypothetical protein